MCFKGFFSGGTKFVIVCQGAKADKPCKNSSFCQQTTLELAVQTVTFKIVLILLTLNSIDTHFKASTTDNFENIVGKEEIARYEQFLLLPQCTSIRKLYPHL